MAKANFILCGCKVADPVLGKVETKNLEIRNGELQREGNFSVDLPEIDCEGWLVAPGLWDPHVHFRDPGVPEAETILSGSRAAAAGGFTDVVTMPNTSPPGDTPEWVLRQKNFAGLKTRIHPCACITELRQGKKLSAMEALARSGAVAFSDDGNMVDDGEVMLRAMEEAARLSRPIMQHTVFPQIAGPGVVRSCSLARRLDLPVFPPEAETEAAERDLQLCKKTGCRLDVQHVSCAATVAMIRKARSEGVQVTGEATPHHMLLSAEEIPGDDANWKMNPPLGTPDDAKAIRQGVLDGTLRMFATDHAPHTASSKVKGFRLAPFGIIGLETAVAVSWRAMVELEGMDILEWVKRWTVGTQEFLGLQPTAFETGKPANLVAIDLKHSWKVDPAKFQSRSRNTPFAGMEFSVKPVLTLLDGEVVFNGNIR